MISLDLMKSSEVRKAADQFKYLKYVQEHVRCRQAQAQPPRLLVIQNSHGFFTRTRTRTMSLFYEGFKAHPYPYYQPKKELENSLITVIGKWMYSNFCGSTIWNMKMDGLQFIWQQLKDIQKSFFWASQESVCSALA